MTETVDRFTQERTDIIVAARGCDFNFDRDVRIWDGPGAYEGIELERDRLLAAAILTLHGHGCADGIASNDCDESAVSVGRYVVRTTAQGFHELLSFPSPDSAREALELFDGGVLR